MGLFSHYVAYRFGRRRENKEWEARAAREELKPRERGCIFYEDLCVPRGECPRHEIYQCVYDE